jgi:malate synthase
MVVCHSASKTPVLDHFRFLGYLGQTFEARRQALLDARRVRANAIDGGHFPIFREDTKAIREGDWKVAPPPSDILDRRVEITGPVDRKMVINGLNSGAKVYMADFEDSTSPTVRSSGSIQLHTE